MKKPLLYIGSVFIFILAAVAFVFVPAKMGDANQMNSISFGKYNGKSIELKPGTEFAEAVNNIKTNLERNGTNVDETQYFYIYNYAFDVAVQRMVAKSAVADSGYVPSNSIIAKQMIKLPYFMNEEGKYDPKVAALYSDESKNEISESIKKDLIQSRFTEDLFGSADSVGGNHLFGLKSNDKETDFIAKIGSTKRSFDLISFDKSNYPEAEIVKFAEENKSVFEKFDLSAISFADEATAKKVQAQLVNNEIKFEDAVKEEYSEKYFTDNEGKITASYQYQVKGILADESSIETIKALAKDSYSDVIKTSSGYTVFKKNNEPVAANLSNLDTIDTIKKYMTSNEATKIEDYFIAAAKNVTAKAKLEGGFDNLAEEDLERAEKATIPAFALNYGGTSIASTIPTDVKPLASASSNENFWEKAFSLKANDYSEPIVLGNYVVVLKFNGEEIDEVNDTKLDSIKNDISSYDQDSATTAISNSEKVEKDIWNAYAKLHMGR